jgi:hypothetical protein
VERAAPSGAPTNQEIFGERTDAAPVLRLVLHFFATLSLVGPQQQGQQLVNGDYSQAPGAAQGLRCHCVAAPGGLVPASEMAE